MKNPFLFKRGKYYHLEYAEDFENIKRISTGCKKKNDALKFLTEFQTKLKNKNKLIPKSITAFEKEYKNYLEINLSKKYLADVTTTFNELIKFIGDIPLRKITTQQLENFITNISKKSKHQAKKHFANLRAAFNRAIYWNYIESNPLSKIKPPKIPTNNPLFISEEELILIINKEKNPTLKDIYLFAFHTGMRLGEIVNLKWNQISLSEKIIKVMNTKEFTTKGKAERNIPINDTLFVMLNKRVPKIINIQNKQYVFNKNGFKFNPDYISKNFKKALLKIKAINPQFHFHDLRHSFASNLVKKGVSLFFIKELLGHKDLKTTQIYSHITLDSLRSAVKVLDR